LRPVHFACFALVVFGASATFASPASAASRICTSADTLSFGERVVGTRTAASVAVSNCGDQPFEFTDVSAHAATNPAYRIEAACVTGMTLAPREQCALTVYFEPKVPGQASGAIWLHNTTSTPDQLVTFYGRGIDAQAGTAALVFSPAVADFGAEATGIETPALVLTLQNIGTASLVPSALVLNGANPYDFRGETRDVASDCGIGRPIVAGGSCTLNLYFRPQALGVRQANLVVDAPQLASLAFLTLTGTGTAPSGSPMLDVVEFHNSRDDQYFLTADVNEIALLDGGAFGPEWGRTGASFRAWPRDSTDPRAVPVCRFFGKPGFGPTSHFYTAYANECAAVRTDPHWIEEGVTFGAMLPTAGACPAGYDTVVRLWRAGAVTIDSRHRYVVDPALASAMQASGWVLEGAVFCAPRAERPPSGVGRAR
jgi:hypothetical protein